MISVVLISNEQPAILISAESFQTYDIFEKSITGVIDLIAYECTYSLITGAIVNYSVNSSFSPVTNVRIRQKRAQTKNGTYELASPLQYDLSNYRPKSTNFTYDDEIGGFAVSHILFILILLVFSFLAFMFLYMGYIGSNYPIFENMYFALVFIFDWSVEEIQE